MLKETEETISFFVTFYHVLAFPLGGPGPPVSPRNANVFKDATT